MRQDLEAAFKDATSLLAMVREKMPLAENAREVSSLAQAFSKASGELRQLFEALKSAAAGMTPEEQAPVLVEAILQLPDDQQARVLADLRAKCKPYLWAE